MTISNTAWHLHHYLARLRVLVTFNAVSAPKDAIVTQAIIWIFGFWTFDKNYLLHLPVACQSLIFGHPCSWATVYFPLELPILPASDGRRQCLKNELSLAALWYFTKSRCPLYWKTPYRLALIKVTVSWWLVELSQCASCIFIRNHDIDAVTRCRMPGLLTGAVKRSIGFTIGFTITEKVPKDTIKTLC